MSLTTSPQLLKAGLVVLDPKGNTLQRTIALQYNPETLSRSFAVQGVGADGSAEKAQPFRLKGPAVETLKLDAELDATDALEQPDQNANAVQYGVAPQIAVLEALVNRSVDEMLAVNEESRSGTLEILPPDAPLLLFVFGANRVVPVRLTDLSVTEEAFDAALNPVRAKVSIGLRVLSTDDLGFDHRGGSLFLNHLRSRERLAGKTGSASLATLGLGSLP